MDIEQYRAATEQEIDATGAEERGTEAEHVAVLRDARSSVADRAEALTRLRSVYHLDEGTFEAVLHCALNTEEPAELRVTALHLLELWRFVTATVRARRADYLAALRTLVDDRVPEIRNSALTVLAKEKDGYAQERLLKSLQDPNAELLPEHRALQLLAYDLHGSFLPMVRRIAEETRDVVSKSQAIRLLGTDPASADYLAQVLRQKREPGRVRQAAAAALQSLAPAEFERAAGEIATDESDDEVVRATCVTGLAHFGNQAGIAGSEELYERLGQAAARAVAEPLKRAVEQFKARFQR